MTKEEKIIIIISVVSIGIAIILALNGANNFNDKNK